MTTHDITPPPLTLQTSHGPATLTLRLTKKPGVKRRVRLVIPGPRPRVVKSEVDLDPATTTWLMPIRIGPGKTLTPRQREQLRSDLWSDLFDQLHDVLDTPWGLQARARTYEHAHPNGHVTERVPFREIPTTAPDQDRLLQHLLRMSRTSLRRAEDAFLVEICRAVSGAALPLALDLFRGLHGPDMDAQQATEAVRQTLEALQMKP